MEVMVPLPAGDFSFDIPACVPLSPQDFDNYFCSGPISPLSQPSNYNHYHEFGKKYSVNEAFAFSIGGALDLPPLFSVDEVFDSGKIKPCEPNRKKIIQKTLSFGWNNRVSSEHFSCFKENAKDSFPSTISSVGWLHKKWRLKDLLFRRASEGHETNKKYNYLGKSKEEDKKKLSAKKKKKNERGHVVALSAHEHHYKVKRAAAEETRKRTYLPYKQNLMIGCMDLAPAGVSEPSRVAIRIR